jgi:hypothetical protein
MLRGSSLNHQLNTQSGIEEQKRQHKHGKRESGLLLEGNNLAQCDMANPQFPGRPHPRDEVTGKDKPDEPLMDES